MVDERYHHDGDGDRLAEWREERSRQVKREQGIITKGKTQVTYRDSNGSLTIHEGIVDQFAYNYVRDWGAWHPYARDHFGTAMLAVVVSDEVVGAAVEQWCPQTCLLYTSPSPRDS